MMDLIGIHNDETIDILGNQLKRELKDTVLFSFRLCH